MYRTQLENIRIIRLNNWLKALPCNDSKLETREKNWRLAKMGRARGAACRAADGWMSGRDGAVCHAQARHAAGVGAGVSRCGCAADVLRVSVVMCRGCRWECVADVLRVSVVMCCGCVACLTQPHVRHGQQGMQTGTLTRSRSAPDG